MPKSMPRWSLAIVAAALLLPPGAAAQSEPETSPSAAPDAMAVPVPRLEGLAWYRSIDQDGAEIEAASSAEDLAAWQVLLEGAGATFDDLEYTYQSAFDPTTLPELGSLATVRVRGAETDALRRVVVGDIVAQFEQLDGQAPQSRDATIGDRDVTVVDLPASSGLEDAIVYAHGDTAWVFLMSEDLAALALEQLP